MFLEIYPHLFWRADPGEYNCSGKSYEEWEATGSKKPLLGLYFMFSGCVLFLLYLIVILAMSHRKTLENSCFKIIYFNCYVDLLSIAFNSILTGYLFYEGAVFCTHPTWGYAPGAFGLAFWCSSCFNCISIGINRCCNIYRAGEGLFSEGRVWIWIAFSCLLMFFIIFFTRQASFNSSMGAWFFFPFIEDVQIEAEKYKNYFHVGINIFTAVITTLLYICLCIKVFLLRKYQAAAKMSNSQYKIFLQCFVVCTATCIAAYTYAYMQFFIVPVEMIVLASFAWQLSSGLPALVYILLNQTIRQRIIRLALKGNMDTSVHSMGTIPQPRSDRRTRSSRGSVIENVN